jgi:hypothetical protein
VEAAAAAATALIALTTGAPGQGAALRSVDALTLRPAGQALHLPGGAFGLAWARSGTTLALVTKPTGGLGFPIRLFHTGRLRAAGAVSVGARDVCGLTFAAPTLVALVSTQLCYHAGGSFSVLRIDVGRRRVASTTPIHGLRLAAPTNIAFGAGQAFVARAGGGVDALDLRTGRLRRHEPRRMLAKGEEVVWTHWLGGGLLGVGPRVVDVRTWRSRTIEPGATGIVRAGNELAAYGARGVALYSRAGRLHIRVTTIPTFAAVTAVGGRLYVGSATVFDLRTRRFLPAAGAFDVLLAP